jgi:hypothetical protein
VKGLKEQKNNLRYVMPLEHRKGDEGLEKVISGGVASCKVELS